MIFNDLPFYNEPGYEYHADRARAEEYNRNIESFTITHAMIPWLSKRLVAPRGLSSAPEASTPAASSPVVSTPATPTTPVLLTSTAASMSPVGKSTGHQFAAQPGASYLTGTHPAMSQHTAAYQMAVQQLGTQQPVPYQFASPQAAAAYHAMEQQAQTVPINPPPAGSPALPFHLQPGSTAPSWLPPGHWIPYYQPAVHLHSANYVAPTTQHAPPPPPPPLHTHSFSSAAPELLAADMANHYMMVAAQNVPQPPPATLAPAPAPAPAPASALTPSSSSTSAPPPALLSPFTTPPPPPPPPPPPAPVRPSPFHSTAADEPAADDPIWADVVRGHFSLKAPLIAGTMARFEKSARATDRQLGVHIGELEGWLRKHGFVQVGDS